MIPGEEVALQHQLLVCDMMIDMPPQIKRKFTPRPKVWKLRDPQTCSRFQEVFKAHVPAVETEAATTTVRGNLGETQDRFAEDNRGGVRHNKAPPKVDVKLGGGIRK